MRRGLLVCVLLLAAVAGAEELTVNSILTAHKMGAPADGIIAMVNNPANTVKISSAELTTLRSAGVPENVIAAIQLRMPVPTPVPPATQPDTPGLVDLVKLVKSGLSETLIIEQLKASGKTYNPTINDLVYLKENAVPEPIIKELLAMRGPAPAPPVRRLQPPALRLRRRPARPFSPRSWSSTAWCCRRRPSSRRTAPAA